MTALNSTLCTSVLAIESSMKHVQQILERPFLCPSINGNLVSKTGRSRRPSLPGPCRLSGWICRASATRLRDYTNVCN